MAIFTEQEWHELFTSTKTTVSTVLDSDGVLKNTLHNLLPSTDLSDTAVWTHARLTSVVASGTGTAGKTRYLLTEDTQTGQHYITDTFQVTSGGYYKVSFDVEANGRELYIALGSSGFGATISYIVDTSTVAVTRVTGGTKDAAFIEALGGNEYRVDIYAEATSTANPAVTAYLYNGSTNSYTGDGSSGVYLSRPRVYRAAVHAPVELVTNGDFSSALSGTWTTDLGSSSGGTVGIVNGELVITQGTNSVWMGVWQELDVTGIDTVTISAQRTATSGGGGGMRVGLSIGSGASSSTPDLGYLEFATTTTGDKAVTIDVSAYTTVYLSIREGSDGGRSSTADNISVTKVITNGMQTDLSGSDYVETSGSAEFHAGLEYDGNGAFRGLQAFEGRTTLNTHSIDFAGSFATGGASVAENDSVSITGDLSASTLTADTSTGAHYINDASTFVSGQSAVGLYVVEKGTQQYVKVKAASTATWPADVTFDLTNGTVDTETLGSGVIVPYGGDRYLIGVIATATASAATNVRLMLCDGTKSESFTGVGTETVVLHWHQVEGNAASVGPLIYANGSTASRGADVTFKALSEFGFKQDQYTVIVEFESAGSDGGDSPHVLAISDGTEATNAVNMYLDTSNAKRNLVYVAGSPTVNQSIGTYSAGAVSKVASAYKQDNFAISDDGDAVVTDTSGNIPLTTTLSIGMSGVYSQLLNGYIKKMVIYPARLTDATLVAESA